MASRAQNEVSLPLCIAIRVSLFFVLITGLAVCMLCVFLPVSPVCFQYGSWLAYYFTAIQKTKAFLKTF